MGVKTENYRLINWQYVPVAKLSSTQRTMHDQYYFDESCQVRQTSVKEAVQEVMDTLNKPVFQAAGFQYACERVKSAAVDGVEKKVRSCGYDRTSFGEAIVCLRIAARVEALKKKIVAGGVQSIATALAPYSLTTSGTSREYANLDLFFKAEAEFTPDFAELCLNTAEHQLFSRSIKYYSILIEFVDTLGVHSRAKLCYSIFSHLVKKDSPQQLVEILQHLPQWKDDFRRVLFDDRSNFGWLRQKQMIQTLKNVLPEMSALILDKEEEFLRLERKIHEHNAAIKTAIYNELLLEAQLAWKNQHAENKPAAAGVADEKKQEEVKAVEKEVKPAQELPDEFFCPITQEVLKDPVITEAGIIYERAAIELWFQKNDTDPMTRKVLESKKLIPVYALKSIIDFYVNQR